MTPTRAARLRRSGTLAGVILTAALLGACTTDPYTGERKVSNTAGGAALGAVAAILPVISLPIGIIGGAAIALWLRIKR